jgi:cell division protein FtsB
VRHRRPRRRNWLGSALLVAACLLLTAYFAEHTFHGRYGLETYRSLETRNAALTREMAALEARRDRLATDVRYLGDPPHPDLIEEGAREILGFEKTGSRVLTQPARPTTLGR